MGRKPDSNDSDRVAGWRTGLLTLGVAALGICGSLSAFLLIRSEGVQRASERFSGVAQHRSAILERDMRGFERDLRAIVRFFNSSMEVTPEEFDEFVLPIMEARPYSELFWVEVDPRQTAVRMSANGIGEFMGLKSLPKARWDQLFESATKMSMSVEIRGPTSELNPILACGLATGPSRQSPKPAHGFLVGIIDLARWRQAQEMNDKDQGLASSIEIRTEANVWDAGVRPTGGPWEYQRPWRFGPAWVTDTVRPTRQYLSEIDPPTEWWALAFGLLLTSGVTAISTVLTTQKGRAERLAQARTVELRQAVEALEREARHREILMDGSSDGIVVTTADHSVAEWNQRFADMLGYETEEVGSLRVWDWQDGWEASSDWYSLADPSRTPGVFETLYRRRDGSKFWVEFSASHAVLGGEPFLFCVVRDVSERKSAQERYETLFREMQEGFAVHELVMRPDGTSDLQFLAVNPAWERLVGVSSQRAAGGMMSDVLPDDVGDWLGRLSQVVQTREPAHFEGRYGRLGRQVEVAAFSPMPGHVACVFSDVTEKVETQSALEVSEARWKFAIEGAGDGVFDFDVVQNRLYWSPRTKEILGYADSEIQPTFDSWIQMIHPADRDRVAEAAEAFVSGRNPSWRQEYRIRRKQGGYVHILARGMVMSRDAEGKPTRVLGTHTNITERKRQEMVASARIAITDWVDKHTLTGTLAKAIEEMARLTESRNGSFAYETGNGSSWTVFEWEGLPPNGRSFEAEPNRIEGWNLCVENGGTVVLEAQEGVHDGKRDLGRKLFAPALRGGRIVGLLSVGGKEFPYTDDDQKLGALFADLVWETVDRKLARLEVEQSQVRWRQLFAQATFGIAVVDAETGTFLDVNDAFCRMLEQDREQLLGRSAESVHPTGWIEGQAQPWYFGDGLPPEAFGAPLNMVTGSGKEILVEFRSNSLLWGQRKVIQGFFRDVTAREEARVFREATLEMMRLFNAESTVGELCLQIVSLFRNQLGWPAVAIRLSDGEGFPFVSYDGYGRDEAGNEVPPKCRVRCEGANLCLCQAVLQQRSDIPVPGRSERGSLFFEDASTSIKSMDLPGAGLRFPPWCPGRTSRGLALVPIRYAGKVFGLLQMHNNRTRLATNSESVFLENAADQLGLALAQRIGQERLGESERRFRDVIEAAGEFIIEFDAETRISYVSDRITPILGYEPAEVLGRKVSEFMPDDQVRDIQERVRKLLASKPFIRGFELQMPSKNGNPVWLSLTAKPLTDAEAKLMGYRGAVLDISERKRQQEEIERFNQELEARVAERTAQLEAAVRELEAFSYSVSHDLRSPLRSIDGFSQMLQADYGDQLDREATEMLQRIRSASHRMAGLIDALLALSRVSRQDLRPQSLDLSALANDIADELTAIHPKRNVEFRIEPGLLVRMDAALARVLLTNLMANAWKFTRDVENPVIEVGRCESGRRNGFYVRDNGAGFDNAYANQLFKPFQRLHTTSEFEGTGIGLALIYRILKRHGGDAEAEGELGKGATFRFFLPNRRKTRQD